MSKPNLQLMLQKEQIKLCRNDDSDYPRSLRAIHDPPKVLYYRGALPNHDDFLFAVVGTRKHTHYAELTIRKIFPPLIQSGAIIVSGLALGIDTLAHRAALEYSGKTIAVLGGGVDKNTLYPQTNYSLSEKIVEKGGVVLSEYPPQFKPDKWTFPARNRIIAGISRGVLVIEAPRHSGALITAYAALEQGRDVFAVPGDITRPESEGCNELIKRGAKPVLEAKDVLEEYGLVQSNFLEQSLNTTLDKDEAALVSLLDTNPKHIDELVGLAEKPVSMISGILSLLEIKGVIKNIGGARFIRL